MEVDSKGNLLVNTSGFIGGMYLTPFDYVSRAYDSNVTETWTFKVGGSGGTTTNTIVIVYTDTTLNTILTVTKT